MAVKFNKLKFCTHSAPEDLNTTGMEAVSVPFDLITPIPAVWNNYTLISGSVSASDLGFEGLSGSNLSFSFSLMKSLNKICLNLYHPPSIVLPEVVDTCNSLQFNPLPKSIGAFVLPREEKRPISASKHLCEAGVMFELKLVDNPEWIVILKEVIES